MAESVILLAILIALRIVARGVAMRMAGAGDRARIRELATVVRAARPGSVILIICPAPKDPAR